MKSVPAAPELTNIKAQQHCKIALLKERQLPEQYPASGSSAWSGGVAGGRNSFSSHEEQEEKEQKNKLQAELVLVSQERNSFEGKFDAKSTKRGSVTKGEEFQETNACDI